jgi:hypothetical protein
MTRIRDIANILSSSTSMATDAEVSAVSAQIPTNVAGKNFVINGGFDVYQRGSFSSSSSGYTLDRWQVIRSGGTATVTQQSSGGPVGSSNHFRLAYTSTGIWNIWQYIESSNVKMLQGRTVTLTAKIRKNATFSSNYIMGIYKSSTANGGSSASWSQVGSSSAINANIPTGTTSSDWLTLTTTLSIPSDGTAEGLAVVFFENAANLNGSYIEISQVQLEIGSVATAFSRAGGSIGGELALCQRYYFRQTSNSTNGAAVPIATGIAGSTTALYAVMNYPVTMRATPTSVDFANVNTWQGGGLGAISNVVLTSNSVGTDKTLLTCTTTGLTNGQSYGVLTNASGVTGFIGLSAEL